MNFFSPMILVNKSKNFTYTNFFSLNLFANNDWSKLLVSFFFGWLIYIAFFRTTNRTKSRDTSGWSYEQIKIIKNLLSLHKIEMAIIDHIYLWVFFLGGSFMIISPESTVVPNELILADDLNELTRKNKKDFTLNIIAIKW